MRKQTSRDVAWGHTPPYRNLHVQIAREIGTRILRGELKPGDVLPDEEALGLQFDVSRTVVRESIRALAAKGLLESRPKRGTIVQPMKFWNRLDADMLSWQDMDGSLAITLHNLLEIRRIVEPPAASLAALRRSPDDLSRLASAFQGMADEPKMSAARMDADIQFHLTILEATHNEFLQPLINAIGAAMRGSLKIINRNVVRTDSSLSLHLAILNAIRDKDADAAINAMRNHLEHMEAQLEAAIKNEP